MRRNKHVSEIMFRAHAPRPAPPYRKRPVERAYHLAEKLLPLASQDWQDDASCQAASDPDIFFPNEGETHKAEQAKMICEVCPVRLPCLEFALRDNVRYGVWGGYTQEERAAIRRRRLRQSERHES